MYISTPSPPRPSTMGFPLPGFGTSWTVDQYCGPLLQHLPFEKQALSANGPDVPTCCHESGCPCWPGVSL
jgi:hypothetical protein